MTPSGIMLLMVLALLGAAFVKWICEKYWTNGQF